MKNLKLFLIAAMVLIASCAKHSEPQPVKVKMTYEQLSKEIGSAAAFDHFDRSGMTEQVLSGNSIARGGKRVKENATVVVWLDDLTLSVSDGTIIYSTVPDADFTGCSKFLSQTSNDGALGIWDCGRYWDRTWQTVDPFVTCHDSATAGYFLRAFTSNGTTGDIHISPWVAG